MDYTAFKEKARQNLTVAEWCFQQGHYDACCNRAYYAMYQAAIAALANEGITPTEEHIDHGWVQSHFVSHFCHRRKIFPKFKTSLQNAQENRNWADYTPERLQRKRAQRQLNHAKEFVQCLLRRFVEHDEL